MFEKEAVESNEMVCSNEQESIAEIQHDVDVHNSNKEAIQWKERQDMIERREGDEETPIRSEELETHPTGTTSLDGGSVAAISTERSSPFLLEGGEEEEDDDDHQQLLLLDQQRQQNPETKTTTPASVAVASEGETAAQSKTAIKFDVQGVDPLDYDGLYTAFKLIVPGCIVGSYVCLVVMPLINYTTRVVWMWIVLWVQLIYAYVGFSQCNAALIAMLNVKHICIKYSSLHQHDKLLHSYQQQQAKPIMSHVFIIPNYNEPEIMLEETLSFLATHVLAKNYTIVLAMEDTEEDHELKANRLIQTFSNQFHRVIYTTHVLQKQVGEARGKASNESWACRYVSKEVELFPERYANSIWKFYDQPSPTRNSMGRRSTSSYVQHRNNVIDPDADQYHCPPEFLETFCSDKVMIHILDADAHVHSAYTQEVEETCQRIIQEQEEEELEDSENEDFADIEEDWGPNLWVRRTSVTKEKNSSSHGDHNHDNQDNDKEGDNFLSSSSSSPNQEPPPPHPGSVVRSIFAPPVIMSRNVLEVPWLTRMQDTSWSAVALQNLTSLSKIGFPLSNYSFTLRLVEDIGFFDTNAEAITEDFHFFSKAFFKTNGAVHLQPIFVPVNMLNLNTDGGWFHTVRARFVQAERHGRVVTEFAYTLRQTVKRRPKGEEGLSRKYKVLWETFVGVAFPPIMPAYLAIAGPLCLVLEVVYQWFSVSPTLLLLVLWTESFGAVCAVIIGCQLFAFDAATRAANTHLYNKPNLSMKDTFLPLPLIFFDLWIYVVGAFVVAAIRSILPSTKNRAFVVSKKMVTSCTTRSPPETP